MGKVNEIDWTRPPRDAKEAAARLAWWWGHFGVRSEQSEKKEQVAS